MNHRLEALHAYPFERLNKLLAGITPADEPFISLALGEPRHAAAEFLIETYRDIKTVERGFATYPPTKGLPELRKAIAAFIRRRFNLDRIDADSEVLPVNGTREALFAIAQAVIDPADPGLTLMPNPFYQIYEGAAILAGSQPVYLACDQNNGFKPDIDSVPDATWEACRLFYLCTPGNPHGAVMSIAELQAIIRKAQEHDFVIVSDECYSELYAREDDPPTGLLDAASQMDNRRFKNCVAFNSLSKRSNLPGLRSGYVAGDADIIEKFLLYRTYHGSAMSVNNQLVSVAAWEDEAHVIENRDLYRAKYTAFLEIIGDTWPMTRPPASFYLWPETPIDEEAFSIKLMELANIKALPGSYLSRETSGHNPGRHRVRLALVATLDECVQAAERLKTVIPRIS